VSVEDSGARFPAIAAPQLVGLSAQPPQASLDDVRALVLALNPYVVDAGPWLRVSDLVRSQGWDAATTRHPELQRLLAEAVLQLAR
jgi:hypothetical protein